MAARIRCVESLAENLAWRIDRGEEPVDEICLLKIAAADMLDHVARTAVQILGGAGFIRGHAVERIYREAPIYGMLAVEEILDRDAVDVRYHGQPRDESVTTLLWDGEWEVTYVTFRDMGAAFGVAIIGIYLLLVGQFRRFTTPLLILTPVPLTLLGIVLGHWLLSAHFTATSMIGFIALAGIVVRNSILLVDFVNTRLAAKAPLHQALLDAGAVRFKPIALTAITTMAGAAFILLDPIFQGLAVSLLFGLMSSTLLTVLVIPAAYMCLRR